MRIALFEKPPRILPALASATATITTITATAAEAEATTISRHKQAHRNCQLRLTRMHSAGRSRYEDPSRTLVFTGALTARLRTGMEYHSVELDTVEIRSIMYQTSVDQ